MSAPRARRVPARVVWCLGLTQVVGWAIVRGTLPLTLFDLAGYGRLVGRLLVPSFVLAAAAPSAYAALLDWGGAAAALAASMAVALAMWGTAIALSRNADDESPRVHARP